MAAPVQETTWYPAAPPEKNVLGRFGYHEIVDIQASKAADEKKYKSILVLFTRVVGDTDMPGPIKVQPENRIELARRFPEAWAAFEGKPVEVGGTPLDALGLSHDKLMELRISGVTRMEHLASLSDQQCEAMGFGTKSLRKQAQEHLSQPPAPFFKPASAAADTLDVVAAAVAQALEQSAATRDAEIAQAVAKALAAQKQAQPAKRRGRPPKQPAESAAA